MFRHTLLIITAALLAACAGTGPAYKQADREGDYGYHENQIAEKRYRVTFTSRSGNQEIARDYALLRAAELTLQKGYDWFEVADSETTVSGGDSRGSAHVGVTHQTATTTNCGLLSCTSTTRPIGSAHVHTEPGPGRDKVVSSVEFVMGKGELPDGARYYQAGDVADTIRSQRL